MILAYAVAQEGELPPIPGISILHIGNLQCFCAPHQPATDPQKIQEDAVRFFQVNQQIFAHSDCLEFRFPTLLRDEAELRQFVEQNAQRIWVELARLRGMAQVTVYFTAPAEAPAASGTEYMREKAERAREREQWEQQIRSASGELARESLAQGDRLHVLVSRSDARHLLESLSRRFQVAGPFPPSSFAKLLS